MNLCDHAEKCLRINCELVRKILSAFIRNEITKFGFERVVVGLSGGVDSSLSAFLGKDALGPDGVVAVIMPYKSSSPESAAHAKEVAGLLGISTVQVDITPQVDAYFERFPDADRVRRGNKMARERMTILYDQSAEKRALVLGTSNKTEFLLGYTTLWGDMACAVNPIGDLYKTQVRQLATHMGVPAHIVRKAPSADLWAAQTDEGELGFTYEEVDRLLYLMVDERRPVRQLAEEFDPRFVQKVRRTMRDTQYKRRMPTVAKVSPRSIDRDFRYSRDWGR
jgi:NAD+ synthase